jgi:nitrate/nitrite transporter NarK
MTLSRIIAWAQYAGKAITAAGMSLAVSVPMAAASNGIQWWEWFVIAGGALGAAGAVFAISNGYRPPQDPSTGQ